MLAIIGGSGLYSLEGLELIQEHDLETPFGKPSAPVVEGKLYGQRILFLSRHGAGHARLPHEVNYRANIFALKQLGATHVLGVSAVGSLRMELPPGALVVPKQYFDHTRGLRERSFFGNGIAAHVSTAEPVCPNLVADLQKAAQSAGVELHTGQTYGCVEGPRLGTQAESFFLRNAAACDLVGMTNVPEVFLAREAQLAYCTLCLVTDYDCWLDDPEQHVSVEKFLETYAATLQQGLKVIQALVQTPLTEPSSMAKTALAMAVMTPDEALTPEQHEWLQVLRA
ncbi:5'-methylthioadenosine phosphorylase [Aliidiomarina shirensis]|uniref:Purine nucleoside phosphorylase n=1 Tax=Aliidiomarina shirensis TaxID=1048642 RepID=A0A432WXH8_9GAMM|nr:MTAP family purine nucleoside phosphorylase [Aliidiomarina shirensis]RUO38459.1 5'-methylthioadenosine phosphorylase [Aliidiomarina shirensis]